MEEITDGTVKWRKRDKRLNALLDIIYPVGSIYTTVADGTPFAVVGFGTWQEVGQGRVLQGADGNHKAESTVEAGLPNIKGYMWAISGEKSNGNAGSNPDSALKWNRTDYTWGPTSVAGTNIFRDLNFDASRSNPIYGKSNTVQPPAYIVHFWRRIS